MIHPKTVGRRLCVLVAVASAALTMPEPTRAGGILVPSYFYPGTGGAGGGDGWAQMASAAAQVPLTAILNPNSGPLSGLADPKYANAMTNLELAGGSVVAYVFTDGGNAPLGTVEGQITTYLTQYGALINGFFLDGMLVTPSTLSYYQTLDGYIKGLSASDVVIGNPGQPFLNGVSPADYLSTADVFNIFEGPNIAPSPGAAGFDAYPYGLNWFENYPSDRFSNVVYDVPADAGDPGSSSAMLADLSRAAQLNAGYVYITNLSGGNPYTALPSYWDQEAAAIHQLNAVPEPSGLTLLCSGGVAWAFASLAKRSRRQRPSRA